MHEKHRHSQVLIVDDDGFVAYALQILLSGQNVNSDYASNGDIAIDMIFKKQKDKKCKCYYKIIILDCNMAVKNGYDTCKDLKKFIS